MSCRWFNSMVSMVIILLVSVCTGTAQIATDELTITSTTRNLRPGLEYEHLLDHTGDLTFDAARTSSAWSQGTDPTPNYGYTEDVGTMTDMLGDPLPDSFHMVGRDVQVTTSLEQFGGLGVAVRGRSINVRAFGEDGRILAEITRFIPEPSS